MPFKSEKQKAYLFINRPDIAKRWSAKYGNKPVKSTKRKAKPASK